MRRRSAGCGRWGWTRVRATTGAGPRPPPRCCGCPEPAKAGRPDLRPRLSRQRPVEPLHVTGQVRPHLLVPGVLLRPAGIGEVVLRVVPAHRAHERVRVVVAERHDRPEKPFRLRFLLAIPLRHLVDDRLALAPQRLSPEERYVLCHLVPPCRVVNQLAMESMASVVSIELPSMNVGNRSGRKTTSAP